MPKRQTNFHLMSRWTKRRYINSNNCTDWVNDTSSSDSDSIARECFSDFIGSVEDEKTIPGPSNRNIVNSPQNVFREDVTYDSELDVTDDSELSNCPDGNHFFLLSSEESDQIISDGNSEIDRPSPNTDFNNEGLFLSGDENEIFNNFDELSQQNITRNSSYHTAYIQTYS